MRVIHQHTIKRWERERKFDMAVEIACRVIWYAILIVAGYVAGQVIGGNMS